MYQLGSLRADLVRVVRTATAGMRSRGRGSVYTPRAQEGGAAHMRGLRNITLGAGEGA
jgi:hypothetical protein